MLENRQIHSRANGCACNIASSSVKNDNEGIREGAADDEEVEHGAQPPLSGLSPVSLAFEMETASLWLLLDKVFNEYRIVTSVEIFVMSLQAQELFFIINNDKQNSSIRMVGTAEGANALIGFCLSLMLRALIQCVGWNVKLLVRWVFFLHHLQISYVFALPTLRSAIVALCLRHHLQPHLNKIIIGSAIMMSLSVFGYISYASYICIRAEDFRHLDPSVCFFKRNSQRITCHQFSFVLVVILLVVAAVANASTGDILWRRYKRAKAELNTMPLSVEVQRRERRAEDMDKRHALHSLLSLIIPLLYLVYEYIRAKDYSLPHWLEYDAFFIGASMASSASTISTIICYPESRCKYWPFWALAQLRKQFNPQQGPVQINEENVDPEDETVN